ncbi:Esterase EstD [Xenorhabdus mauleonii]|uniref:BAAT / Acyl-CoA thioester hydrolase C terminal n=1 Tax=Xenorhabdus mauleonii TaxID=351675 RepID=A0A1I3VCS8_9GAMM|nr:acyl-CoA thioester hydrolase/BAAT C-terminal domain-containing protein [Xenorhabdus mauleonii]PHM38971.1 Esterase EstD [Xenorhabdus mauleonii]SFJ92176.1 BAAT / Acyl-CoA thioester hydrolase C terminal [Xenorhabdus mauleonii]
MIKYIIILSILIFSLPVKSIGNFSTHTLASDDKKDITYYLFQRNNGESKNLLVLIQGSDCKSVIRNKRMIKKFGRVIPDSDLLLIEKYGLNENTSKQDDVEIEDDKCPKAYMLNDSPKKRVSDYIAVINLLKKNYKKVVLLGGSEGAIIANLVTAQSDVSNATISINAGGRYFSDDVIYSTIKNYQGTKIDDEVKNLKNLLELMKEGKLPDDFIMSTHGIRWWKESLSIDNQAVISSIKSPILIIQNMNDINVNVESFDNMRHKINKQNVTFMTYDGLDHFFKNSGKEDNSSIVIEDIEKWFKQRH